MYDEKFYAQNVNYEYQKISDSDKIKTILNEYINNYFDENDDKQEWFNKIKELVKENKELKKKIEELESRALINSRKVTDEQVKKIKELRASGLSYRAIVKEIGLSTCTIQRALKGIYD